MNLTFSTIGQTDRNGILCDVQRAVLPPDSRSFWIAWRTSQDEHLKNSLMLRKENNIWVVYRTLPKEHGLKTVPLPMPYVLKSTLNLLPYQPRAVAGLMAALLKNGCCVDGSDTGLGKSYTSLACARELSLRPAIICKKPGIAGWKQACAFMHLDPLFIVNWEYARNGKIPYMKKKPDRYKEWVFNYRLPKNAILIFDEVHVASNPDTLNSHLWQSSKQKGYAIYLSATLADRPPRLEGLFGMLDICDDIQFRQWLKERGHFVNNHDQLESISPVQDMKLIHDIIYPRYGVRLSYSDLDVKSFFPGAVYQVEMVSMDSISTKRENEAYAHMVQKIEHYKSLGNQAEVMVAELRFRQVAELYKVPILVDYALDYLSSGLSVIVFVNFRETLAELAKALKTRSLIFGDQERMGIDREKVIADFQANRTRLILAMADAGGSSINLHDLHGGHQRISLICPTYNPINLKQIFGRTYRANCKTPPIMKLVYSAGTVEEKVARTVARKLDNIEALNQGDLMEPDLFNILQERG